MVQRDKKQVGFSVNFDKKNELIEQIIDGFKKNFYQNLNGGYSVTRN